MNRLGSFLVRHSKLALFGFISLILLSSVWGFQSFGQLKAGGYENPYSDSTKVMDILTETYEESTPEVVIVVDFEAGVDAESSATSTNNLVEELRDVSGVDSVDSYYSLGRPASLISDDGNATYVFVDVKDDVTQATVAAGIADQFSGQYETAQVYVAGFATVTASINSVIEHDLARTEAIAVPLTIVLLVFVFGSLMASGLPLLVGGLAIIGSFFFVWVSTQFTDTSVFALNLITGLGLGLGIDYALLMVNRFREERAAGKSVADATIRTVESAGRTVLFSGLTVAIVLGSLFFFPQYFLKSFALGGVVVVLLSVAAALIALPAMLNLMGDRVNKWRIIKRDLTPKESGAWGNIARFVMKRPVSVLLVATLALGGLASLSVNAQFGQVDDRILPQSEPAAIASNVIRDRFTAKEGSPIEIILEGASDQQVEQYVLALSELDHIVSVRSSVGFAAEGAMLPQFGPGIETYANGDYQRVTAIHDIDSRSPEGVAITDAIRAIETSDFDVLVGGSAAVYTDSQRGIEEQLPNALIWIVVSTLVLLFLFTGSVLLPIKAVLLNILSLGATIGFITWGFLDGSIRWLVGDFYVTGNIDTSSTVLIAVVAFGLSMDYELFLLSRIKEQHDAGASTEDSVANGLQRSGRIITAAALVLAFSFGAFATSGVTIMKALGLGIAFAILVDATIVRALLVPALMKLFGKANWWAPKWMQAIYKKVGLDH
jgi:putative drug exporter of the RND superfamily